MFILYKQAATKPETPGIADILDKMKSSQLPTDFASTPPVLLPLPGPWWRRQRRPAGWGAVVGVIVFLTSLRLDVISGQSVVLFQRASQCPGEALSESLTYGSLRVRSKVQCAALCLPDFSCQSFIFDPVARRCHLGSQPSSSNCTNMESARLLLHYDMTTSCHNGGVLQVGGSCVCPHGYMGDSCDIIMKDCQDLYLKGKVEQDGVYWIYPDASPHPFQVFCRMIMRPRTYVLNRIYNDVNFTRGWEDYKAGFGDLAKDFWLGLEKLHLLTSNEDYEFRFRVRLRTEENLFQIYQRVYVGDEEEGYRLTLPTSDEIKGDLGDCLSPLNGSRFSTPDQDNDDSEVHCAQQHQAGFWFHGDNCTQCNPTGPLLQPEDEKRKGVPNEVFWVRDLGDVVPYKLSAYLVNVLERKKRRS